MTDITERTSNHDSSSDSDSPAPVSADLNIADADLAESESDDQMYVDTSDSSSSQPSVGSADDWVAEPMLVTVLDGTDQSLEFIDRPSPEAAVDCEPSAVVAEPLKADAASDSGDLFFT